MKALTQQQRKVLAALDRLSRRNGYPPTMAEVGENVGLPNVSAVRGHIVALEKKGYITRVPDRARSIRVVRRPSRLSRLKRRIHGVFRTDKGVAHSVAYGLAWWTAGGEPLLKGAMEGRVRSAIEDEATERGWEVLDAGVHPDHVVVAVKVWPNHSPELTVRRLRAAGETAFRRHAIERRRGPGRRKGSIWARGYAVTTDLDLLGDLVEAAPDPSPAGRA